MIGSGGGIYNDLEGMSVFLNVQSVSLQRFAMMIAIDPGIPHVGVRGSEALLRAGSGCGDVRATHGMRVLG